MEIADYRVGSMINVHFTTRPISNPSDGTQGDTAMRDLFFFDITETEIYPAVGAVEAFIIERLVLLAA